MIYRIEQYFPFNGGWLEIGCSSSKAIALQNIFNIKKKFPNSKFRIVQLIDYF